MALKIYGSDLIGAVTQVTLASATGDDVFVAAGATIGSTDDRAINGDGSDHTAIIEGTVAGLGALDLGSDISTGGFQQVLVGEVGYLASFSASAAIDLAGYASTIENFGTIWGWSTGILMAALAQQGRVSQIFNDGVISAYTKAITHDAASTETLLISNSGLIKGGNAFYSDATARAEITNTGDILGYIQFGSGDDVYSGAAGRLTGRVFGGVGKDTITGGIDNDWFEGGAGDDVLRGSAGNDRLDGGGGADQMFGGAGNDLNIVDNANNIVNETGGNGIDAVLSSISFNLANAAHVIGAVENLTLKNVATALSGTGNNLGNIITGNNFSNTLVGGGGGDTLTGGIGIDTLTGGAGNDFFVFSAPLSAANRDVISDFSNAAGNNDTFRMENAVFTQLGGPGALNADFFHAGAAAHDANDRIIYNKVAGTLTYDSNGDAAGGTVLFATLTNKPTLTAADFVVI